MTSQPIRPVLTDDTVTRLPRWALVGLCILYAVPGLLAHEPWKGAEAVAFGRALDLLHGQAATWDLSTLLSSGFMAAFGRFISLPDAFRLPSLLLLWLTFTGLWYACYHFASREEVQPAVLPFGGQPHPVDYARAVADGSLLGMIASLGLADRGHTGTPEIGQMAAIALLLYAGAVFDERRRRALLLAPLALVLLSLFGAPRLGLLLGAVLSVWLALRGTRPSFAAALGIGTLLSGALWWAGPFGPLHPVEPNVLGVFDLALWFWWPLWLVAGYGLYVRRSRIVQPEIAVPLVFLLCTAGTAMLLNASDGTMLLSLPPLALLAASSLPFMRRTALAAIDWFAVALFTALGALLWVLWIASQTGWPAQIARNIERYYPGYRAANAWPFQGWAFAVAVVLTLAWFALVVWRTSRQRKPLWKGMVLTAGGITLCWSLLQTLGAPMLQNSRSYAGVARSLALRVPANACITPVQVQESQRVLLAYLGPLRWGPAPGAPGTAVACEYAVVQTAHQSSPRDALPGAGWAELWAGHRPADRDERFTLYRRTAP